MLPTSKSLSSGLLHRQKPYVKYRLEGIQIKRTVRRGDIYYAKLDPHIGSEQGGTRPVLILSNDTGNRFSPTVIVAAITSRVRKKTKLPTHYYLEDVDGLPENSIILFEQVRTIDKSRLKEKVTQLDKQSMEKIVLPLFISMGAEKELKAERRISHV